MLMINSTENSYNEFSKIAKGGLAFSFGRISFTLLKFLIGVIVIRAVARTDFGLITLANVIVKFYGKMLF